MGASRGATGGRMTVAIEIRGRRQDLWRRPGGGACASGRPTSRSRRGEFVSLLGPVGLRQVHPDADDGRAARRRPTGEIRVDGARSTGPQTDIGIMFQDNTLVPGATVRGNIDLQLELRGLRRSGATAHRIDDLLELGPSRRLRGPLPVRALGRHAAARRLLPGDGARAATAAARRAARQARRDDARSIRTRSAGALDASASRRWCFVTH